MSVSKSTLFLGGSRHAERLKVAPLPTVALPKMAPPAWRVELLVDDLPGVNVEYYDSRKIGFGRTRRTLRVYVIRGADDYAADEMLADYIENGPKGDR